MDASSDKSPDSGDGADRNTEGKRAESNLPVVWSPKIYTRAGLEDDVAALGAEEIDPAPADEAVHGQSTDQAASESAAATAPRSRRFALLAASVAVAAALGSFVGALTVSGLGRLMPESAPATDIADTSVILRALKSEVAELTALKSSLDGSVRNANAQFATIADRLDRVERASTQLTHIAETVDRLARINPLPETTGSIASGAAPAPPAEPKITDRIVADWVVQDVHGDRALVENRNGGLFEIGAGSVLPGLGRVEGVKRQDGQWVVLTARGVITSGR